MILSILIPTIPDRREKLKLLLGELYKQIGALVVNHSLLGLVEVLVDDRPKFLDGGPSIGQKRQDLVQRATGKFSALLDDDEWIAPNYIETFVRACHEGKDIVTFNCLFKNDTYWTLINMSLQNETNEEANPNGIIKRRPWHVCPVLSEIAKSEQYDNINHNEDWSYMEKILPKIQTEYHINMILTQYNHSEEGSEADKILKQHL